MGVHPVLSLILLTSEMPWSVVNFFVATSHWSLYILLVHKAPSILVQCLVIMKALSNGINLPENWDEAGLQNVVCISFYPDSIQNIQRKYSYDKNICILFLFYSLPYCCCSWTSRSSSLFQLQENSSCCLAFGLPTSPSPFWIVCIGFLASATSCDS